MWREELQPPRASQPLISDQNQLSFPSYCCRNDQANVLTPILDFTPEQGSDKRSNLQNEIPVTFP
ncbi:hypothetical protein EYF80_046982 [Liparis tanakae]|uniref:Uncharacterized protein n=1 Tax=Liparis tanakae TaxID=230148 RepID=A0A4Z2FPW3_9TELE|nr:hypothetical protein EYF80_046982 [Liparis tanakae]